jgi:methylenetetrahydrofolate dehydrogenase (NADP+) / methenyltetrahydrofolate cyclohydrolase
MTATILDGKKLAGMITENLRQDVDACRRVTGKVPRMVNIIMGMDPGACSYAKAQQKKAAGVGIRYDLLTLSPHQSQESLIEKIVELNQDPSVNGIMIHKPVPAGIDYRAAANHVDILKDLEGVNVANIGKMVIGDTLIIPCTPAAVMAHLTAAGVSLRGKDVVVIGASEIVGKPLALLLLREWATVTVCHIATSQAGNLSEHLARADIVVVAVGKAGLIHGDMIKPGAVVIDVGINAIDGAIVGDVDFPSAVLKAGMITPVPGGVGPVTVVMLMRNAVSAFKQQHQLVAL